MNEPISSVMIAGQTPVLRLIAPTNNTIYLSFVVVLVYTLISVCSGRSQTFYLAAENYFARASVNTPPNGGAKDIYFVAVVLGKNLR